MSKYGAISGPCFPVFWVELTTYLDTFDAVPEFSHNYHIIIQTID